MIVIADDITGAAEIAGIAFTRGERVRLVCGCPTATDQTTVIATDTRSMSEDEAVAETKRIAAALAPLPLGGGGAGPHLFKKTDSALRGHVVAELSALMQATGYRRAVYLPANPSKGRIIRGGIYYIKEVRENHSETGDVPIHETAFSYDPEFPAKTSVLKERFPDAADKGILMPDAESLEDIHRIVATYNDGQTLFAGAADLFSALLETTHPSPLTTHHSPLTSHPIPSGGAGGGLLILCGSTQSKPLDLGIPISAMPLEVYDGSDDISLWDASAYYTTNSLILTIPFTHRTGKAVAVHLRSAMARKVKTLVEHHYPDSLIIEGGATAWATLQTLRWTHFDILRQIAPGVVQMRAANGTVVTLKPGSYPWGGLL